jgi:polyisoprenoid-binding protein YceI
MKHLVLSVCLFAVPTFAVGATKGEMPAKSVEAKIGWEAKKVIGSGHQGELKLKTGSLVMEKDKIKSGEFVIDMTSLKNTDITDEKMNAKLIGHLKSDDFFSIEKHPTALLTITKVETAKDGKHMMSGDLTIKGIKKPISFPAEIKNEKNAVMAKSVITVDRTAYDIKYNSLKFFSAIGDKAINDTFTVTVDLTAKK